MAYTRIPLRNIKNVLQNTFNHCSGHVYPLITVEKQLCVLLGHNEKFDNVASFGGFSEQWEGSKVKESLLDTILREYIEESLGCITDEKVMKQKLLNNSALITIESLKGHHYATFCPINGLGINYFDTNEKFKKMRNDKKSSLSEGQLENDCLVAVPLENIKKDDIGEMSNLLTKDIMDQDVKIRGINLPAYRWLFSNDFCPN